MKKPIFQFSLIDDENLEVLLKQLITRLGGSLDESPFYSRRASHLIVARVKTSEKCLCFVANGKWIVTKEYIFESMNAGRFLPEDDYHIINKFPSSSLAISSLKWKKLIDQSPSNLPFVNWNVACFISDEDKAQALLRLIKAGGGDAVHIKNIEPKVNFTLVIYSDETKTEAEKFANSKKIQCYPSLLIADHLLFSVPSSEPVLPIKYYENKKTEPPLVVCLDRNERINDHSDESPNSSHSINEELYEECEEKLNTFLSQSIDLFLRPLKFYISDEYRLIDLVDPSVECRFLGLWKNGAFVEALDLIKQTCPDKILSNKTFLLLIEFLLSNKSEIKQNIKLVKISDKEMVENACNKAYLEVYNYVEKSICFFSPYGPNASYYNEVFQKLMLDQRLKHIHRNYELKKFIDILYFVCINDYLLIKNTTRKAKCIQNCALVVGKMYSAVKLKQLIHLMLEDKKCHNNPVMFDKMMIIIAFCHKYYEPSPLFENLAEFYYSEKVFSFKSTCSLEDVFRKAVDRRSPSKRTIILD